MLDIILLIDVCFMMKHSSYSMCYKKDFNWKLYDRSDTNKIDNLLYVSSLQIKKSFLVSLSPVADDLLADNAWGQG